MASGITHMLLVKQMPEKISNPDLASVLQAGISFLLAGSVGPDLPYASIADDDFFLTNESELADKFHYEKTNQPVLLALKEIKKKSGNLNMREKDALFCFFMGFAAHLIADGIIHPFVRDVVGDYKDHQSEHRVLELKLDVIYLNEITRQTGKPLNLNSTNLHDELLDILTYPHSKIVFEMFSKVIKDVYGMKCTPAKIAGWINGLYRMFDIAEGYHPRIYRNLPGITSYLIKDLVDLEHDIENICTLRKPVDRDRNFLNKDTVHFLNDCVPRFFNMAIPVMGKGFDYIYNDGPELTEAELLPIDLDTGRDLAFSNDLDKTPKYWEGYA